MESKAAHSIDFFCFSQQIPAFPSGASHADAHMPEKIIS